MAGSGIEVVAARALKDFLESKSSILIGGLMSNGSPVRLPEITTSPATSPKDTKPFISILTRSRNISFDDTSPLTISGSDLRVTIILRNYLDQDAGDRLPYEVSSTNHSNIGDRIIGEIIRASQSERVIKDNETGFTFKIIPGEGMRKENSGAAWEEPTYYVVAISEIIFSLGSACEQETFISN